MLLAFVSDVLVAMAHVFPFLTAEQLENPYTVNHESKNVNANFAQETVGKIDRQVLGAQSQKRKAEQCEMKSAKVRGCHPTVVLKINTTHDFLI